MRIGVRYRLASQALARRYLTPNFVQRLQLIDRFDAEEKETIIKLLDGMIAKHNMESTVKMLNDADLPSKSV